MKRLLHIIATPREEDSRTLQVTQAFLDAFKEKHPDWIFDELNLAKEELPSLGAQNVSGKYILLGGKNLYGRLKDAWVEIEQQINRFKTADFYLVSTPMWNFSIPYMLKQYIDVIVQPKHLFRYREDGSIEGLVKDKKMVVIASRGGDYSDKYQQYDFQEPYLRCIFGFIGLTDIDFIIAQPTDMGEEKRTEQIETAKKVAREAGLNA